MIHINFKLLYLIDFLKNVFFTILFIARASLLLVPQGRGSSGALLLVHSHPEAKANCG